MSIRVSRILESNEEIMKKTKIRNRHNQVPHLALYGKVTKTQENIKHKRAQKSALSPAGDHKAARNRPDSIIKTNEKHK